MANIHPSVRAVIDRLGAVNKALRSGRIDTYTSLVLKEGYATPYGPGTLAVGRSKAAELDAETADDTVVSFTTTVLQEDRDGDVVVPMGAVFDNYQHNPVWFFGHQEWEIPIGVGEDLAGRLMAWKSQDRIRQGCRFDMEDPDAHFIHGKVRRGILRATSMAFVPLVARRRDEVEKARTHGDGKGGMPPGWLFEKYDVTENSVVGVPSNAGAIRDALDAEKSFISPRCQKAMGAYAAQAQGCWNGWCPGPACQQKYISHSGDKWVVHAESGKVLGTHDSKEDAERQLRAVEANKHKALEEGKGRGQTPAASSVAGYQVGDTVYARTRLTRLDPSGKAVYCARTGDQLSITGREGPQWQVRCPDGGYAYVGSTEVRRTVPPTTAKMSPPGSYDYTVEVRVLTLCRGTSRSANELTGALGKEFTEQDVLRAAGRLVREGRLASYDSGGSMVYRTKRVGTEVRNRTPMTVKETNRYIIWAAVGTQPKEKAGESNDLQLARLKLSAIKQRMYYSAAWIEDTKTGQLIDKSAPSTAMNKGKSCGCGHCKAGKPCPCGSKQVQKASLGTWIGTVLHVLSGALLMNSSIIEDALRDHHLNAELERLYGQGATPEEAARKIKPKLKSQAKAATQADIESNDSNVTYAGTPRAKGGDSVLSAWENTRNLTAQQMQAAKREAEALDPAEGKRVLERMGMRLPPGQQAGAYVAHMIESRWGTTARSRIIDRSAGGDGMVRTKASPGEKRTLYFNGWTDKFLVGRVTTLTYLGETFRCRILAVDKNEKLESKPGGGKVRMPQTAVQVEVLAPKEKQALSSTSGTAGGYTVPVNQDTVDTDTPGVAYCVHCDGSGNCPRCEGGGEYGGEPCPECGGGGECQVCGGVGSMTKSIRKAVTDGKYNVVDGSQAGKTPGLFYIVDVRTNKVVAGPYNDRFRAWKDAEEQARSEKSKGANMATSKNRGRKGAAPACKTTRAPARKKDLPPDEDDDRDDDLPIPDGEADLDGEERERVEDKAEGEGEEYPEEKEEDAEEPPQPKDSALKGAMAYQHMAALKDWLEKQLPTMDHPGMAEGLTKFKDEHLPAAMEHLKGLVEQHHPDHDFDSMVKALESDGAGPADQFGSGEAGMVNNGQQSPDDVEAGVGDAVPFAGEETPEEELLEEEVTHEEDIDPEDPANDEILERYQTPKGWQTRSLGTVRRTKDGRAFLVRKDAGWGDLHDYNTGAYIRPATQAEWKASSSAGPEGVIKVGGKDCYVEGGPSKSLTKDRHTFAEHKGQTDWCRTCDGYGKLDKDGEPDPAGPRVCPTCHGTGAAKALKSIPHPYVEATKDAAEFLGDVAGDAEVPQGYRSGARAHAKALGQVHKALTQAGKTQRDGGPGSELTDEGTAGNRGSMKDKGEVEADGRAGTPSGEMVEGTGKLSPQKSYVEKTDFNEVMPELRRGKDGKFYVYDSNNEIKLAGPFEIEGEARAWVRQYNAKNKAAPRLHPALAEELAKTLTVARTAGIKLNGSN